MYSKLLGVSFGKGIDGDLIVSQLQGVFESKIQILWTSPHDFMARVLVVNVLLTGSL